MLLQLDSNYSGKDYLIGDVHNCGELLELVLKKLAPHDRLFMVGDLFDRGPEPLKVYSLIQQYPIFVARGNHENMLLKAFATDATAEDIYYFLLNGGEWVLAEPQHRRMLKTALYADTIDLETCKQCFLNYSKIEGLTPLLSYAQQLPYILRVGTPDTDGFLVCHADMPFSDPELDTLFSMHEDSLSLDDRTHLTWARLHVNGLPTYAQGKRSAASMPVYCGHNIVTCGEDAVRHDSNHINLDGGAFRSDCFIVANHTDKQATVVTLPNTQSNPYRETVQDARNVIEMYLKTKDFSSRLSVI